MSLDGYIAGPNGEHDWIVMDPDIDFKSITDRFDTYLMGRRTFELAGQGGMMEGSNLVVVSGTLRQDDYPKLRIIGHNLKVEVTALRKEHGKDIWLFGGGLLFRSLLDLGMVSTVEVAIIPVILGDGIPLLSPSSGCRAHLKLRESKIYPKTGTVALEYEVIV